MNYSVQLYDLDDGIKGNSYEPTKFSLPQEAEFDLTGAEIYMDLVKRPNRGVVKTYSTEEGGITVEDTYSFVFAPEDPVTLESATYYYDVLIVYADGRKETYLKGRWTIHPSISEP